MVLEIVVFSSSVSLHMYTQTNHVRIWKQLIISTGDYFRSKVANSLVQRLHRTLQLKSAPRCHEKHQIPLCTVAKYRAKQRKKCWVFGNKLWLEGDGTEWLVELRWGGRIPRTEGKMLFGSIYRKYKAEHYRSLSRRSLWEPCMCMHLHVSLFRWFHVHAHNTHRNAHYIPSPVFGVLCDTTKLSQSRLECFIRDTDDA